MLTPQDVRELALCLEGTQERDHVGIPSFRVRRIYATLWPDQNWVHLFLTPEMQHELITDSGLKAARAEKIRDKYPEAPYIEGFAEIGRLLYQGSEEQIAKNKEDIKTRLPKC